MRTVRVAAFIAVLCSVAPAAAQFEPIQFAICKKVPVEADRLKCFDAIGPKAKTPEEEAMDPTPVKGRWVYTATTSLVDDPDQVTAVFTSSSAAVTSFALRQNGTNGRGLAKIESAINQAALAGAQSEKIEIDPDTFVAWCKTNGKSFGCDSRAQYAAEVLTRRLSSH